MMASLVRRSLEVASVPVVVLAVHPIAAEVGLAGSAEVGLVGSVEEEAVAIAEAVLAESAVVVDLLVVRSLDLEEDIRRNLAAGEGHHRMGCLEEDRRTCRDKSLSTLMYCVCVSANEDVMQVLQNESCLSEYIRTARG